VFHVKHSAGSTATAKRATPLAVALLLAPAAAIISGLVYPGGNGYSLTRHYLSDLGMTVTPGGENNLVGSFFFFLSCGAFGYSVWRLARGLAAAGKAAAVDEAGAAGRLGASGVLVAGFLAALFFLLTGLTPKNLLFELHNWVSYSAFLSLLLLWVSGALFAPPGRRRALHVVMVLLSAGYLAVLFSRPAWNMPDGWSLQVVAQKTVVVGNWVGMLLGTLFLSSPIVSRET
jgi:hypothetical membrane protein